MGNFLEGFAKGFFQGGADIMEDKRKAREERMKMFDEFQYSDEINRRKSQYELEREKEIAKAERQAEDEKNQRIMEAFGFAVNKSKPVQETNTIGTLPGDGVELPGDYGDPQTFPGTTGGGEMLPSSSAIRSTATNSNIADVETPEPVDLGFEMTPEKAKTLQAAIMTGGADKFLSTVQAYQKQASDQSFEMRKQEDEQAFKEEQDLRNRVILPDTAERAKSVVNKYHIPEDTLDYFKGLDNDIYKDDRKDVLKVYNDPDLYETRQARTGTISMLDDAERIILENPNLTGGITPQSVAPEFAAMFDTETGQLLTIAKIVGLGGKKTLGYTGPMSDYENKFFQNLYISFKRTGKVNLDQIRTLREIIKRRDVIDRVREEYLRKIPDPSGIDKLISDYNKAVPVKARSKSGEDAVVITGRDAPDFEQWATMEPNDRPKIKNPITNVEKLKNDELSGEDAEATEESGYKYTPGAGGRANPNNWTKIK